MSQKKAKTLQFIYSVAFGLLSVAVALLLILQVCDIYFNGGTSPYTLQNIRQHFDSIAVVVYIWMATIVAGFVVYGVFPATPPKGKNDSSYTFFRLKKQLESKTFAQNDLLQRYKKYAWIAIVVKFVCGVCVGICVVFCLAYLSNSSNFTNLDQNAEVAKATLYMLPFVFVAFALCFGLVIFEKVLIKKQLPLAKQLLVTATESGVSLKNPLEGFFQKVDKFFQSKNTVLGLRLTVAVVAVVLLTYGLATGGNAGVLAKAITICRQCIGLG